MDRCWLERPPLAGMGPDHLSACFLQPGYEAIKKDTPNMEDGEAS
jgi:hypothetical protein